MRKKKKTKNIRASKIIFDEKILLPKKGDSENKIQNIAISEIKKFNVYGAHHQLFKLGESKFLPKRFTPVYSSAVDHYDLINIKSILTEEAYVYWVLGIFSGNGELLKNFNKSRLLVNKLILKGDPVGALGVLKELNKSCKSWWSIQMELHVLKEFELGDTRQYLEELPKKFNRADVSNKITDLRLISESSSVKIFIREFLARMKEYRTSGVTSAINYGAIDSCRYLPINYDSERVVSINMICEDGYESLIDQYVIFKEILLENDLNNISNSLKELILDLAKKTDDFELTSILEGQTESNKDVLHIVSEYTNGNYKFVIEKIQNLIENNDINYFGLIEIYARSKIYTKELINNNSFFEMLANDFSKVLQCDKNSFEKIDYLMRICFKFKLESWAKSINFHLISSLEEVHDGSMLEMVRLQTRILGGVNTPKASVSDYVFQSLYLAEGSIPEHRLLKYKNQLYKDIVERKSIPIISDYIKIQSRKLINDGNYVDAINFCIKEYLSNNITVIYLPLTELCNQIESISKSDNETYISCLVIYDIMSRAINNNFEEMKADLFEELMEFNDSHRPSMIFSKGDYSEIESYFLNYICIPSQLDNLRGFISNDDVVHERVIILDLLINAQVEGSEYIKIEKDNVLETLFSEKLRAKIESGKLFVDVQSLISKRKHIYSAFYDQARELKGGVELMPLGDDSKMNSEDIFHIKKGNAVASSKKMELLFTIFRTIVIDFALNENFGLDKYLSAEIRHIVFTTQLRSCFEKTKLVTIKKDGEYLSNSYWLDKYKYVNSQIVNKIDSELKGFSSKIDSILGEVNESFRVEVQDLDSKHVFNYLAYHTRLVRVSEILKISGSPDEFLNNLLSYMWELTAKNARKAQDNINDYLAVKVFAYLDALEQGINSVKQNAAVVDLMQEIKNARTLFTNEIEIVLNWFRFVGSDDSKTLERLAVVIEATMASFDSIYGHKYKKPVFPQIISDVYLTYREARSLFISLFTALENACKYGNPNHQVLMIHRKSEEINVIEISNKLIGMSERQAQELIINEKGKWKEEYSMLNIKEGGTGLYKIYSTLKSASEGFSFDINTKKGCFFASVELKNENFSYRR